MINPLLMIVPYLSKGEIPEDIKFPLWAKTAIGLLIIFILFFCVMFIRGLFINVILY